MALNDITGETTETDAPEDTLNSDLAAAFAAAKGDEPAAAAAPAPAAATQEPAGTPVTETAAEAAARARDEKGRFAQKTADATSAPGVTTPPAAAATETTPAATTSAETVTAGAPPPGWSPTAKAAFAALPPAVQEAVAKREQEVNAGFAKLADFKGVEPYVEMARSRGDSLPGMMQKYVAAEQALAKTPVDALLWLCDTYRVDPGQLVHRRHGGQPQQGFQHPQAMVPQFAQAAAQPQQQPDVATVVSHIIAQRETKAELDRLMSDTKTYPYAENLRIPMAHFLEHGGATTFAEAYERAAWADPEIRSLLISQQKPASAPPTPATDPAKAASDARRAAKSVTGSPAAGASNAPDMSGMSIEDSLRAAFRASRA